MFKPLAADYNLTILIATILWFTVIIINYGQVLINGGGNGSEWLTQRGRLNLKTLQK